MPTNEDGKQATRGKKLNLEDLGVVPGKADGAQRKDSYKKNFSPEHLKHKQEQLQAESQAVTNEAKEAKLRALREGNFQAFTLATPASSPTSKAPGSKGSPAVVAEQETGTFAAEG